MSTTPAYPNRPVVSAYGGFVPPTTHATPAPEPDPAEAVEPEAVEPEAVEAVEPEAAPAGPTPAVEPEAAKPDADPKPKKK